MYAGGARVTRPNITLQSAPGHWAVVASPLNDQIESSSVLELREGAQGGVLRNLELVGGFYYGLMLWTDWENYGTAQERSAQARGASHWLVENVR